MAFNPDQYLKEKSSGGPGGFDPDAYLSQAAANKPPEQAHPTLAADHSLPRSSVIDAYKNGGFNAALDAMKSNKSAYDQEEHPVVAGMAPMVAPASSLGSLGRGLVALNEGKGLAYAAGRTGLSAGQGAVMAGLDGKEGESWQDKLDRAKSGGALSAGIQAAAESVPVIGHGLGYLAKKGGQALTGVAPELIENFAKRTDHINDLIRKSGGDVTAMADQIRGELSNGIQGVKSKLNGSISTTLEGASKEASISAKPMIDSLEEAKANLNPHYKKAAISDIDEMIGNIKAQSDANGMLDPKGLYETKQYLGAEGRGAYQKGGQIFTRASEAARAAKDAAGEARDLVQIHLPEISKADAQLSRMHSIEGRMNKNLLAPGTPEGALMAAGSGANPRNAANLAALEEMSGVPAAQRAMDLATAREFASPQVLPKDFNGKAAARLLMGAGAGSAIDEDHKRGALIGAALTSPMALKRILQGANVARTAGGAFGLGKVAQAIRQNPSAVSAAAQLTASQLRRANDDSQTTPEERRLMQNAAQDGRAPSKQGHNYYEGGVVGEDDPEKKKQIQDASGIGDLGISTHTDPEKRRQVAASLAKAFKFSRGGVVPGKANVPGNSLKNDTVKANLSPGEIVVPRSAASDPSSAAAFAAKHAQAFEPKGEARWAQQGGKKLGLDTEALKKAMSSKESRNLLIEASDLSPGSPRFQRIRARFKERGGQ